jgi:hypothetical protein
MVEAQKKSTVRKLKAGMKNRLAQAFKQAPWRNRVQLVGGFLVALVIVILVASIYLSISGQAATAGLKAYQLDLERLRVEREIANANAQIALLSSSSNMEARAKEMGFERINPEDALYLSIPGYPGKQTMIVTSPPGINNTDRLLVKSIYRESLWDWLFTGINSLSETVIGDGK